MVELQRFLTVYYDDSHQTDTVCRPCYHQLKDNGARIHIVPSTSENGECSICTRIKRLREIANSSKD